MGGVVKYVPGMIGVTTPPSHAHRHAPGGDGRGGSAAGRSGCRCRRCLDSLRETGEEEEEEAEEEGGGLPAKPSRMDKYDDLGLEASKFIEDLNMYEASKDGLFRVDKAAGNNPEFEETRRVFATKMAKIHLQQQQQQEMLMAAMNGGAAAFHPPPPNPPVVRGSKPPPAAEGPRAKPCEGGERSFGESGARAEAPGSQAGRRGWEAEPDMIPRVGGSQPGAGRGEQQAGSPGDPQPCRGWQENGGEGRRSVGGRDPMAAGQSSFSNAGTPLAPSVGPEEPLPQQASSSFTAPSAQPTRGFSGSAEPCSPKAGGDGNQLWYQGVSLSFPPGSTPAAPSVEYQHTAAYPRPAGHFVARGQNHRPASSSGNPEPGSSRLASRGMVAPNAPQMLFPEAVSGPRSDPGHLDSSSTAKVKLPCQTLLLQPEQGPSAAELKLEALTQRLEQEMDARPKADYFGKEAIHPSAQVHCKVSWQGSDLQDCICL